MFTLSAYQNFLCSWPWGTFSIQNIYSFIRSHYTWWEDFSYNWIVIQLPYFYFSQTNNCREFTWKQQFGSYLEPDSNFCLKTILNASFNWTIFLLKFWLSAKSCFVAFLVAASAWLFVKIKSMDPVSGSARATRFF